MKVNRPTSYMLYLLGLIYGEKTSMDKLREIRSYSHEQYLRKYVHSVIENWSRQDDIEVPLDITNLIITFAKLLLLEMTWRDDICGANVKVSDYSTVEFNLQHDYLHTVAVVNFSIRKEDSDLFAYQLKLVTNGSGSWCIGIAPSPIKLNGLEPPVIKSDGRCQTFQKSLLDQVCITKLEGIQSFGSDMGNQDKNGTKLRQPLKPNDTFEFLVDFTNRTVRLFHNMTTDCGIIWREIPNSFVPCVCTRVNNKCVIQNLPPSSLLALVGSK
jgi:hypothetical protein